MKILNNFLTRAELLLPSIYTFASVFCYPNQHGTYGVPFYYKSPFPDIT